MFPNGNEYDGEWANDMKEGYGILTYKNGERYEGYWKADKVHGKGTLVYTYGDQFIGDWVDAKKHGEGELIYANGDRFRGQWLDDQDNGFGVFPSGEATRKWWSGRTMVRTLARRCSTMAAGLTYATSASRLLSSSTTASTTPGCDLSACSTNFCIDLVVTSASVSQSRPKSWIV